MKKIVIIPFFLLMGCTDSNTVSNNVKENSVCGSDSSVEYRGMNDTLPDKIDDSINVLWDGKNMIDASKCLDSKELMFLKSILVKSYRKEDIEFLSNSYYENDFGFEEDELYQNFDVELETRDELCREYEIVSKLVAKVFPMYKPVTKDLYKRKLHDVFGFSDRKDFRYDKDRQVLVDSRFLIDVFPRYDYNYALDYQKSHDFHVNDIFNSCKMYVFYHEKGFVFPNSIVRFHNFHRFMCFDLIDGTPEYQWEGEQGLSTRKYKHPKDVIAARNSIYDKCMEEGRVLVDKEVLERLFHFNNYVFYESKSSLNWMLADKHILYIIKDLFEDYNYDKDTTINKIIKEGSFHSIGTDMYGDSIYRENFVKYIAENCYDPSKKDEFGLDDCSLVEYIQGCAEYAIPGNDKDFLNKDRNGEKNWFGSVFWAYYLIRAYDNYVEKGGSAPRCWNNYLGESLYNSEEDDESLFYKKIKEKKFYGYDFEKRCEQFFDETRSGYLRVKHRDGE